MRGTGLFSNVMSYSTRAGPFKWVHVAAASAEALLGPAACATQVSPGCWRPLAAAAAGASASAGVAACAAAAGDGAHAAGGGSAGCSSEGLGIQ